MGRLLIVNGVVIDSQWEVEGERKERGRGERLEEKRRGERLEGKRLRKGKGIGRGKERGISE